MKAILEEEKGEDKEVVLEVDLGALAAVGIGECDNKHVPCP